MPAKHPLSRSLRNTLGRRQRFAFLAVLLLCLDGSMISIWSLFRIDGATSQMVRHSIAGERLIADAYRAQAINAERYKAVALSSEPEVADILGADIANTQQTYDKLMAQVDALLQSPQEQQLLQQVRQAQKDFADARTELMAANMTNLTERIRKVYSERFVPASGALLSGLDRLSQSQRQDIDASESMISA